MWARGSCSRPARSSTANSSASTWWSPASDTRVRSSVSVLVRPSRIATVRWTWVATIGSWVTITTVVPSSRFTVRSELEHVARGHAVELAGRLVGEQDGRIVGERDREGHPLLLAAREPVRPDVRLVGEAHPVQQLDGPGSGCRTDRRAPSAARRSREP